MEYFEVVIAVEAVALLVVGARSSLFLHRAARRFGDQLGKTLSVKDDSWAALNWGDRWELPLWNFWSEPAERLMRLDPEFVRLRKESARSARHASMLVGALVMTVILFAAFGTGAPR